MTEALNVTEAVVVQPGDTLIIRVNSTGNPPVPEYQAERVRARCLEELPQLADALVVQCDGLAVYRPKPAARKPKVIPLEAKRRP